MTAPNSLPRERSSSATASHELDFTPLPVESAIKTSGAGDLETFNIFDGPFFGIPNAAPLAEAQYDSTYFFRLAPGSPANTGVVMLDSAVATWAASGQEVPEPSTMSSVLLGAAITAGLLARRRKTHARAGGGVIPWHYPVTSAAGILGDGPKSDPVSY